MPGELKFYLTLNAADFRAGLQGATQELRRLGVDVREVGAGAGESGRGLERLGAGAREAGRNADDMGDSLDDVAPAAAAAGAGLKGMIAAGAGLLSVNALLGKLKDGFQSAIESQRALLRFEQLIRQTGSAAGFTAVELDKLARTEALETLGDTQGARDAISVLLTFKAVSGDVFQRAIAMGSDMAEVMGTDMGSAATMLGKALEDPTMGLSALRRVGVSFTAEEKNMIAAFMDANDLAKAQGVILSALEGQMGGASRATVKGVAGSLDTLGQRWDEFWESIGKKANDSFAQEAVDGLSEALVFMTKTVQKAGDVSFEFKDSELLRKLPADLRDAVTGMEDFNTLLQSGAIIFDEFLGRFVETHTGTGKYLSQIQQLETGVTASQNRLKQIEEANAENIEELARRTADRKLTEHERVLASARRSLDEAMQAEEEYAQKVEALRKQLADETVSDEDRLRSLRQSTMSASNREKDKEAQINEKLKASREALAAGDDEAAKSMAEGAKQLAAGLQNKAKALALFEEAAAASRAVTESQITAAEQTQSELQEIIGKDAEKKKIEVDIAQATAQIEEVKAKLAEIHDKTVTVTINQVESGGNAAGLRSGGQLAGYGGGDIIPALLEPGEFVVRKERAAQFAEILHTLNFGAAADIRRMLPGFQAGGPVFRAPALPPLPRFQTGGPVPAAAQNMDTVRLVFDTGRGQAEVLASPAREARRLVNALKEAARGL